MWALEPEFFIIILLLLSVFISIIIIWARMFIIALFTITPVETAQILINTDMDKSILECLHNENQVSNKDVLTTYMDESKSIH